MSGDSRIKERGMLLVPLSLWILEHYARSQMAGGKVHAALLQKEIALLLWAVQELAPFSSSIMFIIVMFLAQMPSAWFLQNGHIYPPCFVWIPFKHASQMEFPQRLQTLGEALSLKLSRQISHLMLEIIYRIMVNVEQSLDTQTD